SFLGAGDSLPPEGGFLMGGLRHRRDPESGPGRSRVLLGHAYRGRTGPAPPQEGAPVWRGGEVPGRPASDALHAHRPHGPPPRTPYGPLSRGSALRSGPPCDGHPSRATRKRQGRRGAKWTPREIDDTRRLRLHTMWAVSETGP